MSDLKQIYTNTNIAVLIPCYNEEQTVAKVIKDFQNELPHCNIYVYDNNSTDKTYNISCSSGAIVKKEYRQGKGNVIRSMFQDIDADAYIIIDGDDTYPVEFCHKMLYYVINNQADMVVGDRLSNGTYHVENKRMFHSIGNKLVRSSINILFKSKLNDIMSGYRCFSKKFVKTIPVSSQKFEIETEMTLHALDKRFILKEIPIQYRDRPQGSVSKLNTFTDGIKVLRTIFTLFKDFKPLIFFSITSLILLIIGILFGIPVLTDYMFYHYVYHVPLAILATSIVILSGLSFICGVILDTVVKQYRYQYELFLNNYINTSKNK